MRKNFFPQARCAVKGCKAYLIDPAGHDTCRSHSYCAYLTAEDVVVWHPDECAVCYGLWSSLSSDEVIIIVILKHEILLINLLNVT